MVQEEAKDEAKEEANQEAKEEAQLAGAEKTAGAFQTLSSSL